MSETKWTKGPWKFEEFTDSDGRGMGYVRPENEDGMEISHLGDMGRSTQENRANGHMHAAATELYDALNSLVELIERIVDCRKDAPYIEAANAALAKARGEA